MAFSPLVSVIIPNYNHAVFLEHRINTVLNQTYNHIEVIILDDCSTDDSRQIIEQYRENPKVREIAYNNQNSGSTFKQWNTGISIAKGEYIWIAESDDYANINFIKTCLTALQKTPNAHLVYTDSEEIDESNNKLGRWSRWMVFLDNNLWIDDFCISGKFINAVYHHFINVIPNASCVIFKKDAYIKSPSFKEIEKLKFTGDWQMWFSILQQSDVCYINQPLNYFRYHNNTTRNKASVRLQNIKEQYTTIAELKKAIKTKPDKNLYQKKTSELYALWNPSIRNMLSAKNIGVFYSALFVDKALLNKLFKTFTNRIVAVVSR